MTGTQLRAEDSTIAIACVYRLVILTNFRILDMLLKSLLDCFPGYV